MNKWIKIAGILLLTLPVVVQSEDVYYTLTVNGANGSGSYTNGQQVEIYPIVVPCIWPLPADWPRFIEWTGDIQYVASVTSATTTVTMPSTNITLTAVFTKPSGDVIVLPPPDWWMIQYGITNAVADQDSDGMAACQEYIAGTNPTNPASVFRITQSHRNVMSWNAVSGRVYSVYWMTNLLSGFQCLESNIPWTRSSFTNSTDAPCGYYKIKVQLEN